MYRFLPNYFLLTILVALLSAGAGDVRGIASPSGYQKAGALDYPAYPDFASSLQRYWPYPEDVVDIAASPHRAYLIITAAGINTATAGRTAPSPTDLFLLSRDGKLTPLTHDLAGYEAVRWSPDEKSIAYLSRQGVQGSVDRTVPMPPIAWAVYVQNIATGARKCLFREKPGGHSEGGRLLLEWIPKQTALLYAAGNPRALYLLPADNAQSPVVLTRHVPNAVLTDLKVVTWMSADERTWTLARLPSDPAAWLSPETWHTLKPIGSFHFPDTPEIIGFSPDRKSVALFMVGDDPRGNKVLLAVLEPETRRVRVLGNLSGPYAGFHWSPDGQALLFTRNAPHGPDGEYSVSIGNVQSRLFAQADWTRAPVITPKRIH